MLDHGGGPRAGVRARRFGLHPLEQDAAEGQPGGGQGQNQIERLAREVELDRTPARGVPGEVAQPRFEADADERQAEQPAPDVGGQVQRLRHARCAERRSQDEREEERGGDEADDELRQAAPDLQRVRLPFARRLDPRHPEDGDEERDDADQRVLDHLHDRGDLLRLLAEQGPGRHHRPGGVHRAPDPGGADHRVQAGPADAERHHDHHRHGEDQRHADGQRQFLPAGARRGRDGDGRRHAADRGGGGDDHHQRPAADPQDAHPELVHEDEDDRRHQPGDEQSRRAEAQDVAEQDLRAQQHEAGLDVELAAQRRPEPRRRPAGVRDDQADQQGPEGVTEAGGADPGLVGEGVGGDGQHEQGNEGGGVAAGGVAHHPHGERGDRRQDRSEHGEPRYAARERLGRRRRPAPHARHDADGAGDHAGQDQSGEPDRPPVLGGDQRIPAVVRGVRHGAPMMTELFGAGKRRPAAEPARVRSGGRGSKPAARLAARRPSGPIRRAGIEAFARRARL